MRRELRHVIDGVPKPVTVVRSHRARDRVLKRMQIQRLVTRRIGTRLNHSDVLWAIQEREDSNDDWKVVK